MVWPGNLMAWLSFPLSDNKITQFKLNCKVKTVILDFEGTVNMLFKYNELVLEWAHKVYCIFLIQKVPLESVLLPVESCIASPNAC